jgi:hypothetical protein
MLVSVRGWLLPSFSFILASACSNSGSALSNWPAAASGHDELAAFTPQLEKQYGPRAGQVFPRRQIQTALPADAALLGWLDIPGEARAADPSGEHWAILLRGGGDPVWVRLSGSGARGAWTDSDTQLPGQLRAALQQAGSDWQPLAQRLHRQRLQPLAPYLKGCII